MCQMCDEYEAELRRMGLVAEADEVRRERHGAKPDRAAKGEPATERDRSADVGS